MPLIFCLVFFFFPFSQLPIRAFNGTVHVVSRAGAISWSIEQMLGKKLEDLKETDKIYLVMTATIKKILGIKKIFLL